jgi:hypothetical protein
MQTPTEAGRRWSRSRVLRRSTVAARRVLRPGLSTRSNACCYGGGLGSTSRTKRRTMPTTMDGANTERTDFNTLEK